MLGYTKMSLVLTTHIHGLSAQTKELAIVQLVIATALKGTPVSPVSDLTVLMIVVAAENVFRSNFLLKQRVASTPFRGIRIKFSAVYAIRDTEGRIAGCKNVHHATMPWEVSATKRAATVQVAEHAITIAACALVLQGFMGCHAKRRAFCSSYNLF